MAGADVGAETEAFAADADAVAHVFVAELADDLEITGDDGHHLARVRRLEPGEGVTAADGSGAWRPYVVRSVGRGTVELEATGGTLREPVARPRLRVACSLTKGQKPEIVVRQLTELGVDVVSPVVAARSVGRAAADRSDALVARLRRVAREAAAQSRRARVAVVDAPVPLVDVLEAQGLVVAERAAPRAAGRPVPAGRQVPAGGEVWTLLVGPEGGFDPAERERLEGVTRLGVGPHVLRAETAAVAAAAVLVAARDAATVRGGPDAR